jgi:hypothetical protein
MIPESLPSDLIRGGYRFPEKIVREETGPIRRRA